MVEQPLVELRDPPRLVVVGQPEDVRGRPVEHGGRRDGRRRRRRRRARSRGHFFVGEIRNLVNDKGNGVSFMVPSSPTVPPLPSKVARCRHLKPPTGVFGDDWSSPGFNIAACLCGPDQIPVVRPRGFALLIRSELPKRAETAIWIVDCDVLAPAKKQCTCIRIRTRRGTLGSDPASRVRDRSCELLSNRGRVLWRAPLGAACDEVALVGVSRMS